MICYSSTGYIMFSLKKLKFHRCRGRGVRGWITQTPPSSCPVILWVLFYKNQIVLHHGDIVFYFDICMKFTLSTIISTMKKREHLTWSMLWLLYNKNGTAFMLQLFYDTSKYVCEKKINTRETLAKHVTWRSHSAIAKFRILKGLTRQKN